jgi:hypothetical protein
VESRPNDNNITCFVVHGGPSGGNSGREEGERRGRWDWVIEVHYVYENSIMKPTKKG